MKGFSIKGQCIPGVAMASSSGKFSFDLECLNCSHVCDWGGWTSGVMLFKGFLETCSF